jgi:predicted nucleotidyltransferase
MSQQVRKRWTMEELRERRDDILAIAEQNGAFNVRVFGSVARGESQPSSDVDFIVTFQTGSSIFDQVGLWLDLQDLLECEVDLLTDHPDAGRVTEIARQEAVPL